MPSALNKEESGVTVAKQTDGGLSNPDKAPALPGEGAGRRMPWGALGPRALGSSTPCAQHLPKSIPTTGLWKPFTVRDL